MCACRPMHPLLFLLNCLCGFFKAEKHLKCHSKHSLRSHELKPCFTYLFCAGTPPSTEKPAGPYPFMVDSDDGRKVPVVQAYAYGKYLGYLNVTFDKKGNVVEAVGNPILLDSSVPEGMWPGHANLPAALYHDSGVTMFNMQYSATEYFSSPELAVLFGVGFRLCSSCTHLPLFLFLNSGLGICTDSVYVFAYLNH